MLISHTLYGASIESKYPSVNYILSEFDVDNNYIYDHNFIDFVSSRERGLKSFYIKSISRGKEILSIIQGMLIDEEISDLFIYLSMIESGFSTTALSKKKAAGLWQFMPATAKEYNLFVANNYDERYDTISSTTAAISFLKSLHKRFGKWYLAIMAYNCGGGRLNQAIRAAKTDDLSVLVDDNLKYLPKETRDYVRKILVVAMIGESKIFGFKSIKDMFEGDEPIQVKVNSGLPLKYIAALLKMDYRKLMRMNSSFKNGLIPKDKNYYDINIPMDKLYIFHLKYEFHATSDLRHMISHSVVMGDTLESIAIKYKSNTSQIKKQNNISGNFLILDNILVVPTTKEIFNKHFKYPNQANTK